MHWLAQGINGLVLVAPAIVAPIFRTSRAPSSSGRCQMEGNALKASFEGPETPRQDRRRSVCTARLSCTPKCCTSPQDSIPRAQILQPRIAQALHAGERNLHKPTIKAPGRLPHSYGVLDDPGACVQGHAGMAAQHGGSCAGADGRGGRLGGAQPAVASAACFGAGSALRSALSSLLAARPG